MQISIEDHDDYFTIEIADNGIGIEKHHLKDYLRVFTVDKRVLQI